MPIVVVVDGRNPDASESDVVYTGSESADDWIARRADELAAASQRYWLVTSDRGLRARAGDQAERTIGGGSFLRSLPASPINPGRAGRSFQTDGGQSPTS
jgi:YacP-like NYN domain